MAPRGCSLPPRCLYVHMYYCTMPRLGPHSAAASFLTSMNTQMYVHVSSAMASDPGHLVLSACLAKTSWRGLVDGTGQWVGCPPPSADKTNIDMPAPLRFPISSFLQGNAVECQRASRCEFLRLVLYCTGCASRYPRRCVLTSSFAFLTAAAKWGDA